MKNITKLIVWISFILLSPSGFAWKWMDLWLTADQQGIQLLQAGKAKEASQVFNNEAWQTVAEYRSRNYLQAFQQFSQYQTSDGQYNAGNALAYLGHYQKAIDAYDKAIALNPHNRDAIINRDIIKKLMNKKNKQSSSQAANNKENNKQEPNHPSSAQQNTENNQPKSANNTSQSQANNGNMNQTQDKQKSNQQNDNVPTANRLQTQDESQKQLLRRLSDNPGGLLQQKFLRDYFRRHALDENSDQGES